MAEAPRASQPGQRRFPDICGLQGQHNGWYYALASGGVDAAAAPGRLRRNVPNPIPLVILGRLAVDITQHGKGLDRAFFRDAGLRVLQAAEIVGIRGILLHAISEDVRKFYLGHRLRAVAARSHDSW